MEALPVEPGERVVLDAAADRLHGTLRPLVVDVDEVLSHSNLFVEAAFSGISHRSQAVFGLLAAALRGPTRLKQEIARSFDPTRLQFDQDTVTFLLQVMGAGRPVYLASATYGEPLVCAIAQHLGVFVAWSRSDASAPLADLPLGLKRGFDYLGGDAVVLPPAASRAARPLSGRRSGNADVKAWAKLLRVHQYAKNTLVLVPLLTAHQFEWLAAVQAIFAAIAFSLCASSAYVLNDIIDVKADRQHPSKRHRPIASGAILPSHAAIVMLLVLAGAVAIAGSISFAFLGVMLGYLALTTAYSFWLKRIAIADVVTLAILYTIRVIAGAVAINVAMSEWLFAFSLFMFMSLALVKRYVELAGQTEGSRLTSRDYGADDKSVVALLAAAAGFNSVVIFTLYISSDAVRALYSHPQLLWINCPILMYWIARVMLFAQRGRIDDDPVIFALTDRVSWLVLGVICCVTFASI